MMRAWLEQLRPALPLAVPGQPAGRPAFRYLRAPAGTMEPQTNRPVYEANRALGAGLILHDGLAAGSSSKEPARLEDRSDRGTPCGQAHAHMAAGQHPPALRGRARASELCLATRIAAPVRGP